MQHKLSEIIKTEQLKDFVVVREDNFVILLGDSILFKATESVGLRRALQLMAGLFNF